MDSRPHCILRRMPSSWDFSDVVLASASPRRRELLRPLVPGFRVVPADLDEDALTLEDPFATAESLAVAKAMHVSARCRGSLVIAADTVVALPGDSGWMQLTKPTDVHDAHRILRRLAGRTHVVVTGVALVQLGHLVSFAERSEVTFRELTDEEIVAYIATGEPMDKAGAYGLQGGAVDFVVNIEGSRNNVIGLPTERLMKEFGLA